MSIRKKLFPVAVLVSISFPLFAHPDHAPVHGLLAGLIHPLTGLDHLAMLLLLGLWMHRSGAGWRSGSVLLTGLLAGLLYGTIGLSVSMTENLVLASVPVAVAAAVWGGSGPVVLGLLSALLFLHGQAHLAWVMPAVNPGFAVGVVAGSVVLVAVARSMAAWARLPVHSDARQLLNRCG